MTKENKIKLNQILTNEVVQFRVHKTTTGEFKRVAEFSFYIPRNYEVIQATTPELIPLKEVLENQNMHLGRKAGTRPTPLGISIYTMAELSRENISNPMFYQRDIRDYNTNTFIGNKIVYCPDWRKKECKKLIESEEYNILRPIYTSTHKINIEQLTTHINTLVPYGGKLPKGFRIIQVRFKLSNETI